MAKWATYEERVREIAQHVYGRPCKPARLGGVNIDGVVILDDEILILIEMTEERTLAKVREDIVKLQTAKAAALTEGKLARCFCVVNGSITTSMEEAGKAQHIQTISIDELARRFFDFEAYRTERSGAPFGSAVNPLTGESDETDYVQVNYIVDGRKSEISSSDIADMLREGKNIILLGEYGSGKSRCVREVFKHLSNGAAANYCYPIAIDLRNSWGLARSSELLRRHFTDLGLDRLAEYAVRAFRGGALALLLDGFDEIGSQAWSNDGQRLKQIRAKSLEGVKDIIIANKGGTLIAGREHYFPNSDEMYTALGLQHDKTVIVRSKDEFNETELLEYFRARDIDVDVPEWLPRRPLICQTISDLAADQVEAMFGDEGNEVAFWNHFMRVLCERDARIHISFDPDTIYRIFMHLARLTRAKSANVGPISLTELQSAFEAATGTVPVEEASLMLQRLPSLGRISAASNDKQFIDVYILDGLRAKDLVRGCLGSEDEIAVVMGAKWRNELDDLGQRILASDQSMVERTKLEFAKRAIRSGNLVLGCDLAASLMRRAQSPIDFEGTEIKDGDFAVLELRERLIENLSIRECSIGTLSLPPRGANGVQITDCVVSMVTGDRPPLTGPFGMLVQERALG